jgi:ribonucleotide reductase alpha subunit
MATPAANLAAFMKLFDASRDIPGSLALRRDAQMGVLRCDHRDIETFAGAKAAGGLSTCKLAAAVSDWRQARRRRFEGANAARCAAVRSNRRARLSQTKLHSS